MSQRTRQQIEDEYEGLSREDRWGARGLALIDELVALWPRPRVVRPMGRSAADATVNALRLSAADSEPMDPTVCVCPRCGQTH